jgi:ribosomal protein S20
MLFMLIRQKAIDKAAKDNVIHANKAARKKSQLATLIDENK